MCFPPFLYSRFLDEEQTAWLLPTSGSPAFFPEVQPPCRWAMLTPPRLPVSSFWSRPSSLTFWAPLRNSNPFHSAASVLSTGTGHPCPFPSSFGEEKLTGKRHTAESQSTQSAAIRGGDIRGGDRAPPPFLRSSCDSAITGDNDSLSKEPHVFLNQEETLPTDSSFNQYFIV